VGLKPVQRRSSQLAVQTPTRQNVVMQTPGLERKGTSIRDAPSSQLQQNGHKVISKGESIVVGSI